MPRPRRKPFWRWTPLPWLALLVLMLVTGSLHDGGLDTAYLVMIVVTALAAVVFAVGVVRGARRHGPNFTAEGRLRRLDGLELVEVPRAGHPITVHDVARHRISIDAARAHSRGAHTALLVPGAGNWWNLRSDIAVYLLSDDGFHLAGRLGDQAQLAWQRALDELRAQGRYVVVPADVSVGARGHAVDVRLEGLRVAA